ncbi:MAG: acetyl-CoA carboxylase biotin carboxylase subunit family protein [Myxococcota bacterium]
MRNVIFVVPFPTETSLRFLRATRRLEGVRLLGVVHTPPEDPSLFDSMVRVEDPLDFDHLAEAVHGLKARFGPIHRLLGILEHIQVELAQLRAQFGVEGLSVEVAERFRDKARMKEAFRAAGLPTARFRVLRTMSDVRDFIRQVGLPIVLKPPAGMGCRATARVNRPDQVEPVVRALAPRPADTLLAEELVVGEEYSLETVTVLGQVCMQSITEYLPPPLKVVENPWIQWRVVAPRDIDGPAFREAHELGNRAIRALGMRSGLTHMEWFRRPDGSLAIGEIAARPPGAQIVRLTGLAHGTSLYRAWARAEVDDVFEGPWPRRHATGAAFLRGIGQGRVIAVTGIREILDVLGDKIVEAQLPTVGAQKSGSYEGDGYILVRADGTEEVRAALKTIIETVRVYYA